MTPEPKTRISSLWYVFMICLTSISCSPTPEVETLRSATIQVDSTAYLYETILIEQGDVEISAIIFRPKNQEKPQPAILFHTIYAFPNDSIIAKRAAERGYISIVSYSRGKVHSTNDIMPYEHDAEDVHIVLDWIQAQSWSNGSVGMYGGSYSGFVQWAAAQKRHPALKTIVPSVSAAPGIAEPMENGIYANGLYTWPLYVASNRYLNDSIYGDRDRYPALFFEWFDQGIAYNKMDSLDGLQNPVWQKWLEHPTYDAYWQRMIPQKEDYAQIDIPVLTTTGYFDPGQVGALHYLQQHYQYHPNPEHYLLIGPYDHYGARSQPAQNVGGYEIDEVANLNIRDVIFEWFDYVLKDGSKPAILDDKINYQVMGANSWRHVPEPKDIATDTLTFYLSDQPSDLRAPFGEGNAGQPHHFSLSPQKPGETGHFEQVIDFADRESQNNYFTPFILSDTLTTGGGFSFVTPPFAEGTILSGVYSGALEVAINKRDFDFSTVLYEYTPDGQFFKLTFRNMVRASLAKDRTQRRLLTPGKQEIIPYTSTRMTSKRIQKGSRLVLVVNGNKHPFDQVNYGTGQDVSTENIHDAIEPLEIRWFNDSFIRIPVSIDND